MECNRFSSVVSIRRSHVVSASFSSTSSAPVSSKSLSFSISAILGLEENGKRQDFPSTERNPLSPGLYVRIPSPQHSYSDTSQRSSPYSDNTSSTSDCDSEPDQVPTHSEQPPRKKRQRTTFSPIEVWELERAYQRRPYLMSEDEEELVQRLGITARSLKYWFQNRRAKSRKTERTFIEATRETNPSNQFGLPVSRLHLERQQPWRPQFPVSQARHHKFPTVQPNRLDQLFQTPPATVNQHSSFKSNQFKSRPFQLPMFHPDQFKIRRPGAEPAKSQISRSFHRYQPY